MFFVMVELRLGSEGRHARRSIGSGVVHQGPDSRHFPQLDQGVLPTGQDVLSVLAEGYRIDLGAFVCGRNGLNASIARSIPQFYCAVF